MQVIYMSASLSWQSLALSQSPSISVTLTGNSVNSFVCVRFVYPSHISFKPNSSLFSTLTRSLSLSHSLLCTLCPYFTHIYLSKKPYGSFISMQCSERKFVARFECSQAKCVSNPTGWNYLEIVFAYTLTPCAHPTNVLFIFFGLTENVCVLW